MEPTELTPEPVFSTSDPDEDDSALPLDKVTSPLTALVLSDERTVTPPLLPPCEAPLATSTEPPMPPSAEPPHK